MDFRRLSQVSHFARIQSKEISNGEGKGLGYRLSIYIDMMYCFLKYRMWTNQYLKEKFYNRTKSEREEIGRLYAVEGVKRDAWQKDFRDNRKFLIKYSNIKYEKAGLREKRNKAYTKRFDAGKNLNVEYDVNISRQHYLDGTISIGNNVIFAKHVFIDYSGDLIIHDNVAIANGVIIETHTHNIEVSFERGVKGHLEIEEGVKILSRAYIADTCHTIGRYARIGAGTYVRNNVPPYAIMTGNPGKIIGFLYSPEEMVEFEKTRYDETNRTPVEQYKKDYQKYFLSRRAEIKAFIRK